MDKFVSKLSNGQCVVLGFAIGFVLMGVVHLLGVQINWTKVEGLVMGLFLSAVFLFVVMWYDGRINPRSWFNGNKR